MISKLKQVRNLILDNSSKSVIPATSKDSNNDAVDLADSHPYQVRKTVKNCRYVYKNEPMVSALIFNNAITANNRFIISTDDKTIPRIDEAISHIEEKVKEWDLDDKMTQSLIKGQRDGKCFIQKVVKDGTILLNFLAYDGEDYDMKIIPDTQTGEIIGFKQKFPKSEELKNWKNMKFDDLNDNSGDFDDANFLPNELIYFTLISEDNEGESFIMDLLDKIYDLWTYEGFKVSVSHKTGALSIVQVGNDQVSTDQVKPSFIDSIINIFKNPVKKHVATVPYGVEVSSVGDNNLPDFPSYMNPIIKLIFYKLQTPQSLFDNESSNRATAEVQTDDDTGYKVFINSLRDRLKKYFEWELIDEELELAGFNDCMGHVLINFDTSKDDDLDPLKPEDIGNEDTMVVDEGNVEGEDNDDLEEGEEE